MRDCHYRRRLYHQTMSSLQRKLQRPPEIVCVKVAGELGVDVDDMNVALCRVTNDSFVVLARRSIGLDINAEGAVEFEFESKSREFKLASVSYVLSHSD